MPLPSPMQTKTNGRSLPEGWRWVKFGDIIAESQPGFASGQRDPKGVIQLRMNNVDTRGNLVWDEFLRVPADEAAIEKFGLKIGDVVFNNTNSTELVGKSALFTGYDEPVTYSNHFTRLRTKPDIADPEFVKFWLISQWQAKTFANICNRWIGQSAVKTDKLFTLEIPLPPLDEQRRIASRLNEQLAAVESARKAAKEQLEAARQLPSVYLRGVFDGQEAKQWQSKFIEDFAETGSGSTPLRSRSDYYIGGKIPWVKTGELKDGVIEDTEEHITELALKESSLKLLPEKTLLIAMYGQGQTRGRTTIIAKPMTVNQACFAIMPNESFDTEFLQFWFRYSYDRLRKETEGRGGNQPNLNGQVLNRQRALLPLIDEQKHIVKSLKEKMQQSELVIDKLKSQLAEIEHLPASLLREAFASGHGAVVP